MARKNKSLGKNKKVKSYRFGLFAEFVAVLLLRLKGYKILARRYKTIAGEIDIIARKANLLVAVEVKARKKNFLLEEILLPGQQKRIKKALLLFLASIDKKRAPASNYNIRFDLIIVQNYKIPQHFPNFWE